MIGEPQTTVDDLIVEYISREPAMVSNVQSHFGLSRDEALAHLTKLEGQGRIERTGSAILIWRLPIHG